MTIQARCIILAFLVGGLGCSLPTEGLAPRRDSGASPDATPTADGGDACVASIELCNGVDDDCDGLVDEDLTRACGSDEGACAHGTEACEGGDWSGTCVGETGPTSEVCEGSVDENCDGTVDEGCDCTPGEMRACGSDVGVCALGMQTCTAGAVWADCVGATGPVTEVCEGSLDEDCDGAIDNGCDCTNSDTRPCAGGTNRGVCSRGTQTCVAGAWASCAGRVDPGTEVCEGSLDEDCDGAIDNGCDCTNGDVQVCPGGTNAGICSRGTQTCVTGAWASCAGRVGPGTETCDGSDEDCDGTVDNGGVCDLLPGCSANTRAGHAYLFCDGGGSGLSWDLAAAACDAVGYHLVVIEDNGENTWIHDQVGRSGDWWIGLTDTATEDTFVWVDGTRACRDGKRDGPPYCHWRGGRPNGGRGENCVRMEADRGSGEWNDRSCGASFPFVCEAP